MYYPKNMKFSSKAYKSSIEYIRANEKRNNAKNDIRKINYFFDNLKKIFKQYEVLNWINFDYCNCYEYIILLHKNQPILDDDTDLMEKLGGKRLDLHLYISVLEKYYYFSIEETELEFETNEWKFNTIPNYPISIEKEVDKLNDFFAYENYYNLKFELVNEKVDNIETELKYKGETTVFDCIFTDL